MASLGGGLRLIIIIIPNISPYSCHLTHLLLCHVTADVTGQGLEPVDKMVFLYVRAGKRARVRAMWAKGVGVRGLVVGREIAN